jgi:hypothetical protein
MRFMIIVKATPDTEAGIMPAQSLFDAMTAYNQELARAGVLLEANGLRPSRDGWRIQYDAQRRTVTDGPFAETKELIAGYTLIQVASREQAIAWAMRMPNPYGKGKEGEIEVRQLYELEDFGIEETADRFRAIGMG